MSKQKKVIRTKRLYQKRSRPKWLGTVLFVLLLVVLTGFGYLVSREWAARFGGGAASSSAPQSEVQSLPSSSDMDSSESSAPVSSEPELQQTDIKGVRMSANDMQKTGEQLAAYLENVKSAGFNAVYIELKTDEGVVTYDTTSELAQKYGSVSNSPVALDPLVKAVRDAGLVPVARISALKDPLAAHVRNENSYGYAGSTETNWLDDSVKNGGKAWLNPYMENARRYLSGLCSEAASRGFETIILENVSFPLKNTEKMGLLNEFTTRDQILGQLVSECQAAAGDTQVFASYTSAMLLRNGADQVKGLGAKAAPMLDWKTIETNKKALAAILLPAAAETVTTEQVITALLTFLQRGESDAVLPLVTFADLERIRPLLEAQGVESYLAV